MAADGASARYLNKLASLRFFAALLVVLFHMGRTIGSHPGFMANTTRPISAYGYVGVSIFFVLSGFVISLANERWKGWHSYLIGRITRIYPPHLIVTFTLILSGVIALIAQKNLHSWLILLSNISLIQALIPHPDFFNSLNVVTWSLSVEMFFYLSFIGLRHLNNWYLFSLTVVAYIALLSLTLHLHHRWTFKIFWELYVDPIARLPEFLTGMCLYRLYKDEKLPRPWLPRLNFPIILAAMISCMHLVGIYGHMGGSNAEILDYTIVPLPFIALLMIALLDDRSNLWMHNRGLVLLGEASFALYLIHRAVIHNLNGILGISDQASPLTVSLLLSLFILLPVATSVLFYKLIEVPVTRNIRRLFEGSAS